MNKQQAVVMSVDVADFSWLATANQTEATQTLASRRRLMAALIAQFGGRTFNVTAEGILAIFAESSRAVEAALNVQAAVAALPAGPLRHPALFRIGIARGELVEVDGQVFGSAVTMAVQLQSLASPGGVTANVAVRDALAGAQAIAFNAVATRPLRPGAEPSPVFEVTRSSPGMQRAPHPAGRPFPRADTPARSAHRPRTLIPALLFGTAASASAVALAGSVWLFALVPDVDRPIIAASTDWRMATLEVTHSAIPRMGRPAPTNPAADPPAPDEAEQPEPARPAPAATHAKAVPALEPAVSKMEPAVAEVEPAALDVAPHDPFPTRPPQEAEAVRKVIALLSQSTPADLDPQPPRRQKRAHATDRTHMAAGTRSAFAVSTTARRLQACAYGGCDTKRLVRQILRIVSEF